MLYAFTQDRRLIRYGTDNAAALCTITIIFQMALMWWCIMRVYPVPLVREAAFGGVCISIGPSCSAAYGAVVLGFKYLCKNGRSLWGEESFCEEAYLHVYCGHVSREPPCTAEYPADAPSVFQHTAEQNSAAPHSPYLVSIMLAQLLLEQGVKWQYGWQLPRGYPHQKGGWELYARTLLLASSRRRLRPIGQPADRGGSKSLHYLYCDKVVGKQREHRRCARQMTRPHI
jgi:hypothetical protein